MKEKNEKCTYELVVQDMHDLYDGKLSELEAHEVARNFIGWAQVLIEINDRLNKDVE